MSTIIKGVYENGQVQLTEPAPTDEKVQVNVVFPQSTDDVEKVEFKKNRIKLGSLSGKISVPENFNEELSDLKEYM